MNQTIIFNVNIEELEIFAKKFAAIIKSSDIILLQGELGTGKTTFARFWINAFSRKNKIPTPIVVKSPTFPIMISYDLKKIEIFHYDLYRLKNTEELKELNLFENFPNNISIIEWPEILMKELEKLSYYSIKFSFVDNNTRQIKLAHSTKRIYI